MPDRPNILVFMTDQQHYATIAPDAPAPMRHVLGLAERGVRFDCAFTPIPQCTPARASTLTGLYPQRHRLIVNAHSALSPRDCLPAGVPTMGEVFSGAGYRTAYVGKWHVGRTTPDAHGFEAVGTSRPKHPVTVWDEAVHIAEERGVRPLAATCDEPVEATAPFHVANDCVRFLEDHRSRGSDQPFFLFASCTPPHVPWLAPEPYASMVDPATLAPPPSYDDALDDKPLSYRHHSGINFANVAGDWRELARAVAKYHGVCRLIDDAFGRVLETLDALGLVEDTLVVFTTDHGEMLGAHGLVGKNELACEELIRLPMVMAGPGVEPGVTDAPITLCDLFATFMSVAGISDAPPADSRDVSGLFTRSGRSRHDAENGEPVIIQHHGTGHYNAIRAIRTARWKYVYRPHEIDELYDLEADPHEMHNRVDDPSLADTLFELRLNLLRWMRQREDIVYRGAASTLVNIYGYDAVMGGIE